MPRPARQATPGVHAKSQSKQTLGALNRGNCTPSVEDVSTPAISNRARRRTQKEVHGSVRTRPTSERLQNSEKTLTRTPLGVLTSPFKVPRRVREGKEACWKTKKQILDLINDHKMERLHEKLSHSTDAAHHRFLRRCA